MKPTIEILERIMQNSKANEEEVFTRLYRYLLRPDIYYVAYQNLYANEGVATKGINDDIADGFSAEKIQHIIDDIANGNYKPSPVRRVYIKKADGKMRPLGIPTLTDKLVQEALRLILEAVYEPIFTVCSHGFRPDRSCHTALRQISREFSGSKWFIEGDIKGCFDNIDHRILCSVINRKIKDARLIELINKFLKAGYLENWKYHKTYSGTPQGGIISPILASIYLNELDKFVIKIKSEFDKKADRRVTPEYAHLAYRVNLLRKKVGNNEGEMRMAYLRELKETRAKMLNTPAKSQTDKKISYVRYADDFLIAVNGNKEDCEAIKAKLGEFISKTLNVELSEEKTLITHSSEKARFLGYDVSVRRNWKLKPSAGYTHRTLSQTVELTIPFEDKINKFLLNKKAVRIKNGTFFPVHRPEYLIMTELEIVTAYNAEVRGICNYYNLASNYNKLGYFTYLMEYSCLKTLANKHKCSVAQIIAKYRNGKRWSIPYQTKAGGKRREFVKLTDCKKEGAVQDMIVNIKRYKYSTTTYDSRLAAKKCELCGSTENSRYEIHHVNKVKNLKGKTPWELYMIAKRRKTIVVCHECHMKIHHPESCKKE